MKTFCKKLENRFLVESTKIESASIPCKTAMSQNEQNGPITKNRVLPVTILFF